MKLRTIVLMGLLMLGCENGSAKKASAELAAREWLGDREADVRCSWHYCDVIPPHPASPYTLYCIDGVCRLSEPRE